MSKKQPKQDTTYITTASGHPIDADVVIINGIKYKRVEEPKQKPETLFDIVRHRLGYSIDCCDEIVDAVEQWLPKQDIVVEQRDLGWNDAIETIKRKIR